MGGQKPGDPKWGWSFFWVPGLLGAFGVVHRKGGFPRGLEGNMRANTDWADSAMNLDVVVAYVLRFPLALGEEAELVTPQKLQKLLYLCQGFHLAKLQRPLFAEDFEAWPQGPVLPSVHRRFAAHGVSGIELPEGCIEPGSVERPTEAVLEEVLEEYSRYSSWGLREMLRAEGPWLEAVKPSVIQKDRIKHYFQQVLQREDVSPGAA